MAYVLAGTLTAVEADARVIAVGGTRLRLVDGVAVPAEVGSSVTVMVEERGGVLWGLSVAVAQGAMFGAVRKPPARAGGFPDRHPDASAQGRQAAP